MPLAATQRQKSWYGGSILRVGQSSVERCQGRSWWVHSRKLMVARFSSRK